MTKIMPLMRMRMNSMSDHLLLLSHLPSSHQTPPCSSRSATTHSIHDFFPRPFYSYHLFCFHRFQLVLCFIFMLRYPFIAISVLHASRFLLYCFPRCHRSSLFCVLLYICYDIHLLASATAKALYIRYCCMGNEPTIMYPNALFAMI